MAPTAREQRKPREADMNKMAQLMATLESKTKSEIQAEAATKYDLHFPSRISKSAMIEKVATAVKERERPARRPYRKLRSGAVIWSRHSRVTGTLVNVVKIGRGEWEVQCTEHDETEEFSRRSYAIHAAPHPEAFCEGCKKLVERMNELELEDANA